MQHIPIYRDHIRKEEKYFWDEELISFLKEGIRLYNDESAALLFATVKVFQNLIKDIDDKRPRMVMMFDGENLATRKETFVSLKADYQSTLDVLIDELKKKLVPIDSVKT